MGTQRSPTRSSNLSPKHIRVGISILTYFCLVLSNPERRRHYDKYGTVADDEEGEAAFFKEFEEMFFGGGFFSMNDDMEEFTKFMESDTKFMRGMMRDLGKNARMRGKRRKGGAVGGGASAGGIHINMGGGPSLDMMEQMMMNMFMMPGMGPGFGKKSKKNKQKKQDEDDGWGTEEEELDAEDGI